MAKLTAAKVKEQTQKILEEIEKSNQRARSKDTNVKQIRAEDAEKKLKQADAPFIYGIDWSSEAPPGGVIRVRPSIWNPTHPDLALHIYVHLWVGSGNIDPVVGTFLLNVDARFPRLTEPRFTGLRPGMTPPDFSSSSPNVMTLDFNIRIPAAIEASNYIGNLCLMQLGGVGSIDPGMLLDRDQFVFNVLPSDAQRRPET